MRCSACGALLLLLAGCSLPPLRGKAEVGKDPYAVFVADGPGGSAVFAPLPTGGPPIPITFSPVQESAPSLSPDGAIVAFLRGEDTASSRPRGVWLLNLLSGAEREVSIPAELHADPDRVGWSGDGRTLYISSGRRTLRTPVPPARLAVEAVPASDRPAADSAFMVLLGAPAFAHAVPAFH